MSEKSNNNKSLSRAYSLFIQVAYPVFSSVFILNTISVLLEKKKIKAYFERSLKMDLYFPPALQTSLSVVSLVLGVLFFLSFLRVVWSVNKVKDKLNEPNYSKANDFLFWLGAGLAMSSAVIPGFLLLSDVKSPSCVIFEEVFYSTEMIAYVAAMLFICALCMSVISMFFPSLTESKSSMADTSVAPVLGGTLVTAS